MLPGIDDSMMMTDGASAPVQQCVSETVNKYDHEHVRLLSAYLVPGSESTTTSSTRIWKNLRQ